MGVKNLFKKNRVRKAREIRGQSLAREQLNMVVDSRIKGYLEVCKIKLNVNRDIIGEHMLEIGSYYMAKIVSNDELLAKLRRHLVDDHQLEGGRDDTEDILRMGEGHNLNQLMFHVDQIRQIWVDYQTAALYAKRTGNTSQLKKLEKYLHAASVRLAMYLDENPIGEVDDPENR